MRTPVLLASVLVATAFLVAQNAEDRLVEAELLEVSAGDLERAMAAYKAIAADEKTPAPVKARALLALGRSQRKAGQLESAKKTLADLIAAHPGETETVRQAKGFLEELESGRARNPSFDWIADVEKSPEIQARVFDWCMTLVGSDTKAAAGAARQLLALGPIALPVVERVLDASRDDTQRYLLATIAVRAGRLERLAQVLEAEDIGMSNELWRFSLAQYLDSVGEMPERERTQVLEAAARVPETPKNAVRRAALLLAAGDRADVARKVKLIEESHLAAGILGKVLEREPSVADLFAERMRERSLSLEVRRRYFDALLYKTSGKLALEDFDIVAELEGPADAEVRVRALEAAGRFDVLEKLAEGGAAPHVLQHFLSTYKNSARIHAAPGAWGRVLRKLRQQGEQAWKQLHLLGEANDEAAVELAGLLANRRAEAPGYTAEGSRPDPAWTPSPRYAELMAGLLESDDPVTLAISIEALALAPKGVGPEVLPATERLVLGPPDIHVREFAIYALLKRFASRPETGPEIARILLQDFRLRSDLSPEELFKESPIPVAPPTPRTNLGRVSHTHPPVVRTSTRSGKSRPTDPEQSSRTRSLEWVSRSVGNDIPEKLLPDILALPHSEDTKEFLQWYRDELLGGKDPTQPVIAVLERLESPAQRAAAVLLSDAGEKLARTPKGLALLRSVAMDAMAPGDARATALFGGDREAAGWFDWPRFLAGDDPLLAERPDSFAGPLDWWMSMQTAAVQEEILSTLARNPSLARLRLRVYPRDREDRVQVLESALADGETQWLAIQMLLDEPGIQSPALYRKLLETPPRLPRPPRVRIHDLPETPWHYARKALHDRIRESPDESLIEPLVKFLDDKDPTIRKLAAESLSVIRADLAQREEWRVLLETVKAKKKD